MLESQSDLPADRAGGRVRSPSAHGRRRSSTPRNEDRRTRLAAIRGTEERRFFRDKPRRQRKGSEGKRTSAAIPSKGSQAEFAERSCRTRS